MSEFVKKVLVFDEIQKGYAAYGKRVSGVVRLEKQNNSASAEIYVANLDRRKAEELQFVIYVDKKIYLACSQTPSLTVSLDMLKDASDAACLVAAVNDGRVYPFAFASNAPFIQAEDLSLHLKNDVTEYEEFVCATDNYFEKETSFDIDELKKHEFRYVILDESQNIKNATSQTSRAVKELKSKHRLALSGTPIENRLEDSDSSKMKGKGL